MATLLEKFEASAKTRLPLPTERDAPLDLAPFRRFLKVESHRLRMLHGAGGGGREICQGYAGLMDVLLCNLWQRARHALTPQARKEFPPMALVALGGYGRGEMNPKSDLDIMVLHYGQVVASLKPLPHLAKALDFILLPLYDLGFKVGHCVRTVEDCVKVANEDMQTKTSLIEARLIIGDEKLFQKLQRTLVSRSVVGYVDDYVEARIADQNSRRKKYGDSPTMQEPNIKNGCGGLRDFQNLCWMAFFKHRTRSLEELQEKDYVTALEARHLEAAYDFLLRVRNELHFQTGKPMDVLSKSLQPAVAHRLGFTDRSPRLRLEKFMREFYYHTRHIYLISRTLEERLALLPKTGAIPALKKFIRRPFGGGPELPQVDGFIVGKGQIHAPTPRVFRDQPRRLMRVFLHAQKRGLKLHPDTAQFIRNQLRLVDRQFIRDEHVRETFLEIMNARGDVSRILRAMHEVGFLGKYLPEFGRLTCLVQHEFYHRYTADEHTLMCLERLDRIWESTDPSFERYSEEFQKVEKPFVLYLALLLHDAGKALEDSNHSRSGARLSDKVARRLGLDGPTTHSLRLLIEHHLTMASVSQRRDLGDQGVIRHFADLIETQENLRMLTLHTLADSLATSDKLWNGFKDSLLRELQRKTMTELAGGTAFLRAEARQRQLLAEEVRRLIPERITREELDRHFEVLPPRYFQIHPAREITADLHMTNRFMARQIDLEKERALEPVVTWIHERDRGYTRVKVCTWDREGLFSILSGSFGGAAINILSAQVFTRDDNIALDTFLATDAIKGGTVGPEARREFEVILKKALTRGGVDFRALINRQKEIRPIYQALEGETIPVRIVFDNHSSSDRTVVEIETEDRLGLLYFLSSALTDLNLNITLAKILTEKGAAIDSFYLSEEDGSKVKSEARQRSIESHLRKTLSALAKAGRK